MTREEKLFDAVTRLSSELVEEGAAPCKRQPKKWIRYAVAVAACGAVVLAVPRLMGPMGSPGGLFENGGGGAGHDQGTVFLSYAGPVFPLDVTEPEDLTAARKVTLDLSPYGEGAHSAHVRVTDSYTLTNTGDTDRTTTVLYPFVGSLRELEKQLPTLTVEGETVETTLYQGGYSGGFQSAGGTAGEDLNLRELNSWTEYRTLLADGDYQADALAETVDTGLPVTVYRFEGAAGPAEYNAATLEVYAQYDGEQTHILTYGFSGYRQGENGGRYSYWLRHDPESLHLLVVVGGDLTGMQLQGYEDGGCDWNERLEVTLPQVIREETTLDVLLEEMARDTAQYNVNYEETDAVTVEMLHRAAADLLVRYGLLSEQPVARYADDRLDDLFVDALGQMRVFYLAAEVTVPAGESLTVEAALNKEASFDYACARTENRGVNGYDLTTALGSDLPFTAQYAALEGWQQVDIIRQNFGFDPELGVTEVPLTEEHYYLEVRKKSQ